MGIILLFAFFLIGVLYFPHYFSLSIDNPFLGLYIWWILIAGVSFIDELWLVLHKKFRVSPKIRLLVHVVAAIIAYVVSGVGITQFELPGGMLITFGPLSVVILTVAWYLMFTNAINRFDGIYGLATGMSCIGFTTIALLLSVVVFQYYPNMSREKYTLLEAVYYISLLLAILSALAFYFERKPLALVRDMGTMFLWFALAYLWLVWWAKIGMMIVVLALPLFDAVFVIIDRLHRRKQHPFQGDYSHLHYRLLALWWNRNEVRVFVLWLSSFLLVFMLLLGTDRIGKVIIFLLIAVVFFGVNAYLFWIKGLPVEYTPGKEEKKKKKLNKEKKEKKEKKHKKGKKKEK